MSDDTPNISDLSDSWRTPITLFSDYLKFERQYSAHTVNQYVSQLGFAALYFNKLCDNWFAVQSEHIRRYSMALRAKQLSGRTISLKLSCIRSLYKFLKAKNITEQPHYHNPAQGIKGPKFAKPLPKNLDVDQMARLLEIPDDDPLAIRDKAMMELMYSSGLRISELVGANMQDINARNGEILVRGKGAKERLIPVGSKALEALKKWLAVRPLFMGADEHAVFLSSKKNRISVRQVRLRMQEWGIKQGISSQVHPHKLRHSFASHILESSGDLRAVQELLGHSSLSATQVYTHLDFQHLAKVYDNTHPRAKKRTD
ncbi:MAG: integrase/recombinase XerC [Pseudoalteromonas tetraodonis]|jgi:integrase/recombinase XerC|uniref:Tyrosine recombinase XerC n=5 Tax=Pseudoalteromonas TaxID=53246 RepID=A0A9W4QVH7_PSEHA|nr:MULTISPECIES: tyrosine recombinase XerC [Pseudoalteromonas]ADT67054.1 site-specific recombinase [Pseudoalteromonas sp. SM9913]ALQ53428.1 Tyrosine recombinase XerC [Pseudoalteromonas issachenkonii]ATC89174.1 integrase/recombinase XerC [Pseudoalteromonas issachenkonii]KGK00248.1 Tyrosine recombinase xerC [Pseudoalteromonas sp. ND6B]KYL31164.1 tyrosine recombinase XerC [Pseudoalteromonas spiralis]|tara:strand:+ start:30333 stop:31277 length:945 start_codon:yes stop_codon:yes gene_type:complete